MSPRLDAPIIIVGAGGSGSTLLDRMLGAHPEIDMLGEMKFLMPDAWSAFGRADANTILRDLPQHFDADPGLEASIKSRSECFREFLHRLEENEYRRRGTVLAQAIEAWFCLDESAARFWGFKEITNNGVHDWGCYDHVFPHATWVHIVRHPLDHLHAAARLSATSVTEETLTALLSNWVAHVEVSRKRAITGRFYEIKYEDLRTAPEQTLTPLLDVIGLRWHDECGLALSRQWGARSERQPLPPDVALRIATVESLAELMSHYGYRREDIASDREALAHPQPRVERMNEDCWKLVGPFWREAGHCWEIDLSHCELAAQLRASADEVGHWERSALRLFENGSPLPHSHALHYRIRRDGGGHYSHWQHRLLFSTSDNSSPNENGRSYHFAFTC